MERLSAIAELAPHEQLLVKQAYLATPAMVGRESPLEAVRVQAASAKEGRGGSLSLQGPPGIGRSRMLEATGLEAKRLGMLVLRADARDAQQGDYGVVRALARCLLTQAPTLARKIGEAHLGSLERIVPELRAKGSVASGAPLLPGELQDSHRVLQPLLRQWFGEVSAECPLMLAIDDLERIDPPSAAFIGLIAREVQRHPILLVTGRTTGATPNPALLGALQMHARYATVVALEALDLQQTQTLLGSLFGDVPNLPLLAQHVQRITRGNPRDVLRLAEHLVSENVVSYQAGTWSVPDRLSTQDLPSSMTQALEQRTARLSAAARRLCYGLSCEPTWAFRFDECERLLSEAQPAVVMKCLNELVASEFIEPIGEAYGISQSVLGSPLRHGIEAASLQTLHAHLARVCAERADMFRSARHLLRAQQHEEGLRVMVEFAIESVKRTDANTKVYHDLLSTLPSDWLDTFELALALCDQMRRPALERRAILLRLVGLGALEGPRFPGFTHVLALLDQLGRDAGLDCFSDLPPMGDPLARVQAALGRAAARYRSAPEDQRVSEPGASIPELATTMTVAIGVIGFSSNFSDWARLPSLVPLCPLSPTLAFVQTLYDGMGFRIGGRSEAAILVYRKLLERLDQPDRLGLPVAYHRHTQLRMMGAIGVLEAGTGKGSCLEWVTRISVESRFDSMALTIIQLHQMFQGDLREAKRTKQRLEQLRLESNSLYAPEAQHMFLELSACALAQDMTGVKRAVDALAPYEALHPGCRAGAHYGRCEYHRMRGDARRALSEVEAALALMEPGQHLLWVHAASTHLRVLLELGQVDQACTLGEAYLRAADALGSSRNHVRAALALARMHKGDHAAATDLSESAVAELRALGSTGLHVAVVCEARAQVAATFGDDEAYERYSALYSAQWPSGSRRLHKEGDAPYAGPDELASDDDVLEELRSTWETCHTIGERLDAGLELLARHMGALGGVLFTRTEAGLVRTASFGESAKDTGLDVLATDYFTREVTHYETEEIAPSDPIPSQKPPARASLPGLGECAPVLLGHNDEQGYALTGVVVLVGPKSRRPRPPATVASELSRCVSDLEYAVSEYL
jgi:hypothetical protein